MNWVLTIPTGFSMRSLIKRSEPLLLPPFSVVLQQHLEKVEHLTSGKTLLISLTQIPAGLHLQSDQRLNGAEAEEVSQKVWRMLRLGENFAGFSHLLADHPVLTRCLKPGYRFLRGSTFFEDLVKAQILGFQADDVVTARAFGASHHRADDTIETSMGRHLTMLVDHLGSPLATNPTRHAFPTPSQIAGEKTRVKEILGADLGHVVLKTAERFMEAPNTLAELLRRDVPLETITQTLRTFPGMTPAMLGLSMLSLGRYDYLPLEDASGDGDDGVNDDLSNIRDIFSRWHPWSGLIYWLWDWKKCPCSVVLREGLLHEQTAY